jgi:ABC-type Fe3+ transport system substrate-binding protein
LAHSPRALVALVWLIALACAPAPARPAAPAAPAPAEVPVWQAEWDRVVAGARLEGTVSVLGPPGDLIRKNIRENFQKSFPDITLEWSGGTSPELATKLEAERRAGVYSADVFIAGTGVALTQVKPTGALQPIRPALILPEVADGSQWFDGRLEFADTAGELNLVFGNQPLTMVLYDQNRVQAGDVDHLQKLLAPQWKGLIAAEDPTTGGRGSAVYRWIWQIMGPEQGAEIIRALRGQIGFVDRDRRRLIEAVARGRYPVLLSPDESIYFQLAQEGLKAGVIVDFKDYGTYLSPGYGSLMLLNQAPHPNAARVFVNWLLTQEGQLAFSTAMNAPSRRLDVPTDHLPAEVIAKPGVRYATLYKEEQVAVPPELGALLRELFSR